LTGSIASQTFGVGGSMRSTERAELTGTVLDEKYQIGRRIGVGGTGVVFDALRLADGETVVVKTMRPMFVDNHDLRRRLRREAEVARTVHHPGIVPVLDEGVLSDGSPYIVMTKICAESLSRMILREGTLAPEEAVAIAMRVASILHAVHAHGYVHRDVKPEHVLLRENEHGGLDVLLLDFGVCAAETAPEDEKERERGRVFGTPTYVSPEQASGRPEVDARADVYGLGVLLFESLVGRVPFSAANVTALLKRIIREDAPRVGLLRQSIDRELDAVIARALAREPGQRFTTARALSRALAPHARDRWQTERALMQRLAYAGRPAAADARPTAA
jgi:serine/threonine-protein kinase